MINIFLLFQVVVMSNLPFTLRPSYFLLLLATPVYNNLSNPVRDSLISALPVLRSAIPDRLSSAPSTWPIPLFLFG